MWEIKHEDLGFVPEAAKRQPRERTFSLAR